MEPPVPTNSAVGVGHPNRPALDALQELVVSLIVPTTNWYSDHYPFTDRLGAIRWALVRAALIARAATFHGVSIVV